MVPSPLISRYPLRRAVPDPRREPLSYETADVTAIRDAVTAVSTVALKRGELVFGGHPAISPLVLIVASMLDATDRVRIFQSEYFATQSRRRAPPFAAWSGHRVSVPIARRVSSKCGNR